MGTIRSQDAEDWLEKAIGPITSTRPIGGKRWNGSSAGLSGFEHEESFVVYSCRCRETEEMQQNPTVKMLAACIGGAEKEFLVKTSSHKVGLQSSPTRSPPPRSTRRAPLAALPSPPSPRRPPLAALPRDPPPPNPPP